MVSTDPQVSHPESGRRLFSDSLRGSLPNPPRRSGLSPRACRASYPRVEDLRGETRNDAGTYCIRASTQEWKHHDGFGRALFESQPPAITRRRNKWRP
jgi:hypothetical protein